MRRSVLNLCLVATLTATLAGCGGDDGDTTSTASDEQTSPSVSESASASGSPSESAVPGGCEPPTKNVEFTGGTATLDVTSGPDQGSYDLTLDKSGSNGFAASDGEITGNWLSEDEQAVLFIDIEGVDPCQPEAFTSIGTQGKGGPVFIDSSHTSCTVELTSLGDEGAEGTFSCTGMTGGGEGLERDAEGTFTLVP